MLRSPNRNPLSPSYQCPVRPLISRWILTVRPTRQPCRGTKARVLWSILALHNPRMESPCSVTAAIPPAPSKGWSAVAFTISLWQPLTASATARSAHLCRPEQVSQTFIFNHKFGEKKCLMCFYSYIYGQFAVLLIKCFFLLLQSRALLLVWMSVCRG